MTVARFTVGQTYSTRSIGDHDCIYSFQILGRTAKTVTIEVSGTVVRRGLSVPDWQNVEQFRPFGTYSMCAIIHANDPDLSGIERQWISRRDPARVES